MDDFPPLSEAAARAGMPLLLEKLRLMTRDAETLKAALYSAGLQFEAVADGLGIPTPKPVPTTTVQVELTQADAAAAEQLVDLLQHQHPGMSTDDCINDIFMAGLTTTAHRLIPADSGEEHF